MKNTIQSVKGTRDYYPAEMGVRTFLYQTARHVSESFGYQEWDGPFLEELDLYAAKSGEELVKEQAFVFPDRSGDMITLRPELTPTLARMVAQRQQQLIYPLRWWSWGPFWRYEQPQKGRTREFFQWNIDLIGVDTPEADAEMIAIAAGFLKEAGLAPNQVSVLVNNRKLMNDEMANLEIAPEIRPEVLRLIDRRDKMSDQAWENYTKEIGLSDSQCKGLKTILSDNSLWERSSELVRTFDIISTSEIRDYVRFAPHVIRGLDYYTGTVFEAWDQDGEFRAILGGGRYDNLVSDVGGDPLPATGFAMGDLVVSLVLEKFGCLPKTLENSPATVLVTVFSEDTFKASFSLATQLRQSGIKTSCFPQVSKLGKQFRYGDRMGVKIAVVLGPDELENESVTIKDLCSGKQQTIPQLEIIDTITELLSV